MFLHCPKNKMWSIIHNDYSILRYNQLEFTLPFIKKIIPSIINKQITPANSIVFSIKYRKQ